MKKWLKRLGAIALSVLTVGVISACELLPMEEESSSPQETVITSGELTIRFPELGNKYTGDCTLIKVGDTEW